MNDPHPQDDAKRPPEEAEAESTESRRQEAEAAAADADGGEPADRNDRLEARLQRAMADLANVQRRKLREIEDARQRAVEAIAAELLPVVDNFHLALGATEHGSDQDEFDLQTIVDGMRMVRSMLESVLERHGLTEIDAEGRPFDPNLHEAVGIDDRADAAPGTVTRVVQRGYRIADKVLRPSRVVVSGQSEDAPDANPQTDDPQTDDPQREDRPPAGGD